MAIRRELARTLAIDAIAPYVVYVLAKPELGEMAALGLSAVPPAIEAVWSVIRRRRLDVVSALVLGGIAVSLGLIALGGSERVLLLRESLITSVVGLAVAASVVMRRPLLYYLFREGAGAGWAERYETEPALRRQLRVMSLVWGLGLVVEMAVRSAMVFWMETSQFLLISPFVQYGITGALVLWTIVTVRRRPEPDARASSTR